MGLTNLQDLLELGSFLLMLYAAGIAIYVTQKARRLGFPLVLLPLLLSSMTLLHGVHHLFAFLGISILEQIFELAASVSALALALTYTHVWRRP